MRFTYNQYKHYESGYRIPSKMHNLSHHQHHGGGSNNTGGAGASGGGGGGGGGGSNNTSNNHYGHHYNNNNNNNNNNTGSTNIQAYQHHYKSNFGMRMTMSTNSTMSARIHRKGFRIPSKRQPGKGLPGKLHTITRAGPGKIVPGKRIPQRPHPPPCDNSNDSGLGFDQHTELRSSSGPGVADPGSANGGGIGMVQRTNLLVNSSLTNTVAAAAAAAAAAVASNTLQQHHQQHQQHQQQQQQQHQQQHSPQQHLIRAIPVSRSRHTKKMLNAFLDDLDLANSNSEESTASTSLSCSTTPSPDADTGLGNHNGTSRNSSDPFGGVFQATEAAVAAAVSAFNVQHQQPLPQQQQQQLQQQFQYPGMGVQQQHQHQHQRNVARSGGKHIKRKKLECNQLELDNDDACSEDEFIRKIANAANGVSFSSGEAAPVAAARPPPAMTSVLPRNGHETKFISARTVTRVANKRQPTTPLNSVASSNDGHVQLEIVSQPEQQHRARYQTEGSRGAVKDRSGNGFPIVRLTGYDKGAVLQVFIGTDIGRVAPHMFYQACKVAGKNSTQCNEKKVDGTMVIEIDFKPETDMTITCDCVGILKERNVDVEHRFPEHLTQKNKKKSTRCRMVFRTQLTRDDGTTETLQVCSNPIICTQPPGVPEIGKKSLNSCPVDGGLELFIIGKNFLKDTHVVFQETYDSVNGDDPATEIAVRQQLIGGTAALWEQSVMPDKEYLHQTHLICTVPPYLHQNVIKPVSVQVSIISSGKKSEPHTFTYTPKGQYSTLAAASTLSSTIHDQAI
ncbi:homeotic protein female sterile isoform X6 [Drosophila obscura]|uniref:homeotic protein female sterile isoform X6 n=1 Tax=Drosophila obscura TaxID=7282 RepID=UPI001BB1F059|nr:homeotic protein female sterile isoform X6 [Drosophila obscura]